MVLCELSRVLKKQIIAKIRFIGSSFFASPMAMHRSLFRPVSPLPQCIFIDMISLIIYHAVRGSYVRVCFSLPYSDLGDLTADERLSTWGPDVALEQAHTRDDQIGGQLTAGFVLTGFHECHRANQAENPIARYMPSYIATRAEKPR